MLLAQASLSKWLFQDFLLPFHFRPPRVQARSFAAQRRQYLAAAFHETFHHIGKTYSAYSDESLGRAAFALTGDSQLLPNDHDPLKWSSYWDNQLMKHCMPDLVRAGNVSK
jgi:hypothetical protein